MKWREFEMSKTSNNSSNQKIEVKNIYPLSPMQEGMLFHYLLDKESKAYFVQQVLTFEGKLDISTFEKSFNYIVERYDILRTIFEYEKFKKPMQVVLKNRNVKINYEDISSFEDKEKYIKDFTDKDRAKGFDLRKDVLIRIAILKVDEAIYKVIWSFHHILMDGWCNGIIANDIFTVYQSLLNNKPISLEPVYSYKDYIDWLKSQNKKEGIRYWDTYLKDYTNEISILGIKDESTIGINCRNLEFKISENDTREITRIAYEAKSTVSTVLHAIWGILLQKYNDTDDVVFGTVVSGRNGKIEGIENIVGLFINAIPIRVKCDENTSFLELLTNLQNDLIESNKYDYMPLAEIQSLSELKHRLINNLMVFENYPIATEMKNLGKPKKMDFEITDVRVDEQTNYNFNVEIYTGKEIVIKLSYNENMYDKDVIERIQRHFEKVIDSIIKNNNVLVKEIHILSEEERHKLLYEFNDTYVEFPKDKVVHKLFEEQVEKTPDAIAVVCDDRSLTYRELNERANRLARTLRDKGVWRDSIVGLMVERSMNMLIGILAIFKAGGAYLPIDTECPQERVAYMLENSNAMLVLTEQHLIYRISFACDALNINDEASYNEDATNLKHINSPGDLAYVIYTSGSTGKPKGAMVEQVGMINHLYAKINTLQLDETTIIVQNASYCFDISVWQFLASLIIGGHVVIYRKEVTVDPEQLVKRIINDRISILEVVPSFMYVMLDMLEKDCVDLEHLKFLLITGEALNRILVKRWFNIYQNIKLVNAYGPTEASDDITHFVMDKIPAQEMIPIGKPVQNFNIYIVDKSMNLCPVGIPGEITVSGIGVGRGYLNDKERTLKSFMEDPFSKEKGVRLYKTSDIGRWSADGNIEFLGRIDYQVKIRGNRIELGEIENRLLEHGNIKEAVVIDRKDNQHNTYLCAYLVTKNDIEPSEIREHLLMTLPEYMLPSYFVRLESLPLNSNGKIDRKALPEPNVNISAGSDYEAPRNDIEEKLALAWQEVLGIDNVGINDNFFNLGGDSIKAIQIVARVKKYNYMLEMKDLFSKPIIKELSKCVKTISLITDQGAVEGGVELTPIQSWFFDQSFVDMHHWNQSLMIYSKEGFKQDKLKAVFDKILIHHDALRMRYAIEAGKVAQFNKGINAELYSLDIFDLRGKENYEKEIEMICNKIQGSIDLNNGPLVKLALFNTCEGDHLLIAIHHLVIDGVSWRILLEDLSLGYRQALKNEDIVFQHKTSSFREWARGLKVYASNEMLLKEIEYWKQIENTEIKPIPKDYKILERNESNSHSESIVLSKEETEALLKNTNKAYNTKINDILLTALGLTMKEWTGEDNILVTLEGYGRQEILDNIDITRTIGWFTTHYPVVLNMNKPNDIQYQIEHVRESMRRIPNEGIGYGILRYLANRDAIKDIEFKINPEIIFNYLGQLDEDISTDVFTVSRIASGNNVSDKNENKFAITINGMVVDGRLNMSFSYNKKEYSQDTILYIAERYKKNLNKIIEHCSSGNKDRLFAADFIQDDYNYEKHLEEDVMMLLNNKVDKNIFAFPPIFGYGLCYIPLAKLVSSHSIYSFDFIESDDRIAKYANLITSVQSEGPYILMGYCIGGNLAFEVAKELEKRGCEISDIILIDSEFLEEKERDLAYYEVLNKRNEDMFNDAKEYARLNSPALLEHIGDNVRRKIKTYSEYEESITSTGIVNTRLYNILSTEKADIEKSNVCKLWKKLTTKDVTIYQAFGKHRDMLNSGYVEKNVELVKSILNS